MTEEEFRSKEIKPEATQVFLVIVCDNVKGESYGLFSSIENAAAWAEKQEACSVISPYIVDEPEYGNVRAT